MACISAQNLSIAFKNYEAVLLPVLHQEFIPMICHQSVAFPNIGTGVVTPDDVLGTRSYLVDCSSFYGASIEVQRKHEQFGSVILHRECDLTVVLSTALGKAQTMQQQIDPHFFTTYQDSYYREKG